MYASIEVHLVNALLTQFAEEGIEPARQLLLGPPLGFEGQGLRQSLLTTCQIMGVRFPEYDEIWTPSSFIANALAPVSPIPVVRMPTVLGDAPSGSREAGRRHVRCHRSIVRELVQ